MPRPYSADLRERVLAAWEQGEGTAAELAHRFRVSKARVTHWRRALRTEGRRHAKCLSGLLPGSALKTVRGKGKMDYGQDSAPKTRPYSSQSTTP